MTLHLLNYNNYYNRIIKRETNLAAYIPYRLHTPVENVNFIPNNDITTTQIINWDYSDVTPDYLIVADGNTIKSRWFIIESERLRQGQYRLVLKRDLVVDYYDKLIAAPCFIDRATLENDDPYIFNDEGITFNQVKKNVSLLKDGTQSTWYVGYMANNLGDKEGNQITITKTEEVQGAITYGTVDDIPFSIRQYIRGIEGITGTTLTAYSGTLDFEINTTNAASVNNPHKWFKVTTKNGIVYTRSRLYLDEPFPQTFFEGNPNDSLVQSKVASKIAEKVGAIQNTLISKLKDDYRLTNTPSALQTANRQIIYIQSLDKYYSLNLVQENTQSGRVPFADTSLVYYKDNVANNTDPVIYWYDPPTSEGFEFDVGAYWNYTTNDYYLRATVVEGTQARFTLSTTRNRLNDAPYTMFAIPRDYTRLYVSETGANSNNPFVAQKAITAIINELGINQGEGGYVYDVQLLPYCPVRNFVSTGEFTTLGLSEGVDYSWITDGDGNKLSIIVYPQSSTFRFSINYNIPITNPKVQSQTEMYRLCSPNYDGVFEFNAAVNGGVSKINVECTYKPFNPYIYVAPEFGGLYGQTFSYEQRGLVCGGDFSIPLVTDAWRQYELQNKNYQQIFDREIQNLETNREVQREQEKWARIAGSFTALASGAGAGSIMGGLIPGAGGAGSFFGGVAGGVGAGLTSYLTAGKDIEFNDRLYKENKSYQEDLFKLNLANIKALPNSLARIGAMTANNPIFPFIEFYQATDEELTQFSEWLYYHGMNVGKIGKIQDYLKADKTFIRGSLLRIEDIAEDTHLINELAAEIREGVFI